MPASGTRRGRAGGPLLKLLFWAGVALAPVAALLILLSDSQGPLRVAAVLTVLAVVLTGLSVGLRPDSATVRLELEETFLEEVDLLREDLRNDVATAARATHRQFSEKLQVLYESVESLRAQVDGARYVRPEPPHHQPGAGQPGAGYPGTPAAGQARAGAHVGGGAHAGDGAYPGGGQQAGVANAGSARAVVGSATVGSAGSARVGGGHGGASHAGGGPGHPGGPGPVISGGVVRHTETVQVTTRHTVVDPHGGAGSRGTVYGGTGAAYGYGAADDGAAEPSWTEQRLRERFGYSPPQAGPDHPGAAGSHAWQRTPYQPVEDGTGTGEWVTGRPEESSWSGRRAGAGTVEDRWASVRSDDRGRELRMGERRAALHADRSGSELRIEDRWASVRRDEWREEQPRGRRRAEDRRGEDHRAEDRRAESRWGGDDHSGRWGGDGGGDDRWGGDRRDEVRDPWDSRAAWSQDRWTHEVDDTGRWGERRAQPALPAASSEPTWSDGWSAARDEGGHRRDDEGGHRYDDEGGHRYRDDDTGAGGYGWDALADAPVRPRERWG